MSWPLCLGSWTNRLDEGPARARAGEHLSRGRSRSVVVRATLSGLNIWSRRVDVLRMTAHSAPAAPRRALGLRLSVWHYLVALALIPAIAFPGFAALFTQERLQEARATSRVEHAMQAVQALDDLRGATQSEVTSTALAHFSRALNLSVEQLNDRVGYRAGVPLAQARFTTDRALDAVLRSAPDRPEVAALSSSLAAVRRSADAPVVSSTLTSALTSAWPWVSLYNGFAEQMSALESAFTSDIASGHSGVGGSQLQQTAHQLQEVTSVALLNGQQTRGYLLAATAPKAERAGVLNSLQRSTGGYQVLADDLGTHLDPVLSAQWQAFRDNPDTVIFQLQVNQLLSPNGTPEALTSPASGRAVAQTALNMSAYLRQAVAAGTRAARLEHGAATRRAVITMAVTAVLLLSTLCILLIVGGTIRRRLRSLAATAVDFSAGRLDPAIVRGPQEVAAASEALNDAIVNLQEVERKAEILASGDLNSAELERPASGPLGAAVHASVQRIVETIRERQQLQRQLEHQASHDALTGLPNRAEAHRLLTGRLSHAERAQGRVAVLFVDLDRFKECNDSLGHLAGDHVLRVAGQRISALLRPEDSVCRLGGDEFLVLLEFPGSDRAVTAVGERIVDALNEPIEYHGNTVYIGGSVGVAITSEGESLPAETLLHIADLAVYAAKAAGRGVVRYSPGTAQAPDHATAAPVPLPRHTAVIRDAPSSRTPESRRGSPAAGTS
jgi:diguanylate cyclase (GGDEF)-like protein